MDFLCDVHIAFRFVRFLSEAGHLAVHVNSVLDGSRTRDSEISAYADSHCLVVISKDRDFRNSYLISQTPQKVIRVCLGNVSNEELIGIFTKNLGGIQEIDARFDAYLIELTQEGMLTLITSGRRTT